jgi:hypothetical protein
VIPEELFVELELERVQNNEGRGAEDEQPEESQRRATQMFNKMIFDRSLSPASL